MKIAVIGSGISGLSIANLLNKEHKINVYEKDDLPGGLIKCSRINNCLFHKVGGHVFNTKIKKVSDWFWSHFDKENEFVNARRNAKIYLDNKIIGYPIENYLFHLDKKVIRNIINELLSLKPLASPFDYKDFAAFLRAHFGETLYALYFKPYNEKIWKTDLASIPMEWLEGKLPMPNIKEIVTNNILREEENEMVHSFFYYPKNQGSQFIIDRLKKNIDIKTNSPVDKIENKHGKLVIENNEYDKVIYCGDVRKLPSNIKSILLQKNVYVEYIENLRSNGTSNLFCETDFTDISWLYIPQNFTLAHRIIYTGNFSNHNNEGTNRSTCVVEFSGYVGYEEMMKEIKKLPGNLSPLSHNYEPNSYVIQDARTRSEIAAVKKTLAMHNIYLLGRFAEWEYYNMDTAINAAFNLYETAFKN